MGWKYTFGNCWYLDAMRLDEITKEVDMNREEEQELRIERLERRTSKLIWKLESWEPSTGASRERR